MNDNVVEGLGCGVLGDPLANRSEGDPLTAPGQMLSHYAPGAFYERHVDAFKGQSNRILSTVTYLNPSWQSEWGGEFVLYQPESNTQLARERPEQGKLVIFMSEGMPHEVLVAAQDRYSIAGWFRARPIAGI